MPTRPGQAAALAFGPQAPPAAAELSARQPVSPTIFLPVVLQPPAARNFWLATYYVGESLAGDPVYTAEETRIDYDWGDDGHPPGVSYDHFSARWVGDWEMEVGRYTFFVYADDGVRLWVDGRLVVDAWTPGMGDHEATVDVVEAGAHNLRLEYFEVSGGAAIRLHWRRTDLYPRWEAEYYRLPWVQEGLLYETLDDTIQFDWGLGAPAGLPTDGFSVAWHTRRLFEPGTNRLYVYADDGYRLWLDGNLLGQGGWEDGEAGGQVDVVYTYEAPALGYHNVTYQFHDRGSLAEARLWPEYAERPAWQAAYFPNRTLSGDPVAVRDEDARDNYRVWLRFRDRLAAAPSLESAYLRLFQGDGVDVPPAFVHELTQVLLRHILGERADPFEARAAEMGSQPFTQLAVDTGSGFVFLSRESGEEGLTIMATGKKGSRVGLALYDLKTCLRDAVGASAAKTPKGKKKRDEQ